MAIFYLDIKLSLDKVMFIFQQRYVQDFLEAFNIVNAQPISYSMDANQMLEAHDGSKLVDP